jgi:hypothetical protein
MSVNGEATGLYVVTSGVDVIAKAIGMTLSQMI